MLKISLFELVTRGIPEGFLFILANLAYAKKKIIPLPYLVSSILLIIFTYCARLLDINFGVHTILNLICLVSLSVYINKIDLFKAVKGSMFATLIMVFVEAINVVILQFIFKDNLKLIIDDPFKKALAGIPGIMVYGVIIISAYLYFMKINKNRGENGTVSE